MARRIMAVGVFLAVLALACVGLLAINTVTPLLPSGSFLPTDLDRRQYVLTGARWDEELGGYHICFRGECREDLTLTVADADEAAVFFWGEPISAWDGNSPYQRVVQVRLNASVIREKGGVDLVLRADTWGNPTKELLSRRTMSTAKLALGGAELAAQIQAVAFGVSMFSLGLQAMLIVGSLVLYGKSSSEKYLLLLAWVAGVSLIATLLTTNLPILPIRRETFRTLRPLISICPVMLHAAIPLSLFRASAPKRLQPLLTTRALLLLTLALVAARILSSYSIYTVVRWVLAVPVVWTLSAACGERKKGSWTLLVGYGLSEAVVVFLFLINNFQISAPGEVILYLHLNQLSYVCLLLAAMLVIDRRYADKFRESERLSRELSVMNESLDRLVEERTGQLREEQRKKNTMMTNIFHDLRSPIFVLQGCLDQLRPGGEEAGLLETMGDRLDFLKRLTEDLFLLSKLEEEGAVLYEEERLDLSPLLFSLAEGSRAGAAREGIELIYRGEGPLVVWGDRQRLQQAFQNLLDNALRYTPSGGRVTLEAAIRGEEAVVSFQDTGHGIAPEELPFIFDRYFKSSRARNSKSSGLGLTIAREIVEHHRGRVSARSTQGEGSCFTVFLPILED